MTPAVKISIVAGAIILAAVIGRYTAPEKVRVETKTVTVEKVVTNTETHKKTTTTDVVKPDGAHEIVTVATDDTNVHQTDNVNASTSAVAETTRGYSKTTLAVLGGLKPLSPSEPPVFGGIVTRPILGPITVGVWGMSTGTFGAAFGLTF